MSEGVIPLPTTEDMARDPVADLAICQAATPGPWINASGSVGQHNYEGHWVTLAECECGRPHEDRNPADAVFVEMARTATEAWIRRAVTAEDDARRLREWAREASEQLVKNEDVPVLIDATIALDKAKKRANRLQAVLAQIHDLLAYTDEQMEQDIKACLEIIRDTLKIADRPA